MGNITMQNYSARFPIVMLEHSEREMARNGQHYDAKLLYMVSNSDAGTFGEREMARNGQHYDAKLLCTVSNSDVGTFEERDGQEWATL